MRIESPPHSMPQPCLAVLLRGRIARLIAGGPFSVIAKQAAQVRLDLGRLGLERDPQADLDHHGGVDKALHHYPAEHCHA